MKTLVQLFLVIFCLSACTSSEVNQVNYYLLDKATISTYSSNQGKKVPILLSEVRLANYLKKSNLPIQLADHRLYYSREHVWAEPLSLALKRTLLKDLNQNSETNHFVTGEHPNSQNIERKVIVQFDHFIATEQSSVIVTGKYWLVDGSDTIKTKEHTFSMSKTLQEDGFPYAVTQLRELLLAVSNQITLDVSQQKWR